jgi:hypothetical protein
LARDQGNPSALFKYITMRYGCNVRGHPGLVRESQVEALSPYLNLLEPLDIRSLWDACNDRKWFAVRHRLLDERLESPFLPSGRELEQMTVELDKVLSQDEIHFLDHQLDRYLDAGVAWSDLLDWMSAWLDQRRSLKALDLVAMAIRLRGTRKDLHVLDGCKVLPEMEAKQMVANAKFIVKRSRLL